jgi:hypothetical protein
VSTREARPKFALFTLCAIRVAVREWIQRSKFRPSATGCTPDGFNAIVLTQEPRKGLLWYLSPMTFDRMVSVISVVAVAIAAAASALQGYVSWSGRNDFVRSAAIAQIVKACGDFENAADRYVQMNDRTQSYNFTSSLHVLVMSMAPISYAGFDVLDQEALKVTQATNPSMTDQQYWAAFESAIKIMKENVEVQCIKVTKEAIGG